jgi:hypothetical protein
VSGGCSLAMGPSASNCASERQFLVTISVSSNAHLHASTRYPIPSQESGGKLVYLHQVNIPNNHDFAVRHTSRSGNLFNVREGGSGCVKAIGECFVDGTVTFRIRERDVAKAVGSQESPLQG